MSSEMNGFTIYDCQSNVLPRGSDLKPSQIHHSETTWIYAKNAALEAVPVKKRGGKWMLFVPRNNIDAVWDNVLTAIKTCDLRHGASVSTVYETSFNHALMIFTSDYTDVMDVIKVLDYLEQSGIKPRNTIIKYKTELQSVAGIYRKTNAGIYRGLNMNPWLYSSDSIRSLSSKGIQASIGKVKSDLKYLRKMIEEKGEQERKCCFEYDIGENELVSDCILNPSEFHQSGCDKLYAKNNKYSKFYTISPVSSGKSGQWELFEAKDRIDDVWNKIKAAIMTGDLWLSEVTQVHSENSSCAKSHVITISTKDYADVKDVIQVLEYLESAGIKSPDTVLMYKTKAQTRPGVYRGSCRKRWIYSSDTIRSLSDTEVEASIMEVESDIDYLSKRRWWEEDEKDEKCFFEYDISKHKLVSDCILEPSEVHSRDYEWLYASNNKYIDDSSVDFEKIGEWVLVVKKYEINPLWKKVKSAIAKGDLWEAKVSTVNNALYIHSHIIMIFTKDYSDRDDVIEVLKYLERNGLTKPGQRIKYVKGGNIRQGIFGHCKRSEIYSSDSIRKQSGRMDYQYEDYRRRRFNGHGSDSLDWRMDYQYEDYRRRRFNGHGSDSLDWRRS